MDPDSLDTVHSIFAFNGPYILCLRLHKCKCNIYGTEGVQIQHYLTMNVPRFRFIVKRMNQKEYFSK